MQMKTSKLVLALSLLFLVTSGFSQKTSIDVSEIKKIMILQEDAWNKGSVEGFMEYYWKSDSLIFYSKKGVTKGWQANVNNYIKSYPNKEAMGKLSFTIVEGVQYAQNVVLILGKWKLLGKDNKEVGGEFTLVWKRINKKWVIVMDHTT
jgi:hypothetical protein